MEESAAQSSTETATLPPPQEADTVETINPLATLAEGGHSDGSLSALRVEHSEVLDTDTPPTHAELDIRPRLRPNARGLSVEAPHSTAAAIMFTSAYSEQHSPSSSDRGGGALVRYESMFRTSGEECRSPFDSPLLLRIFSFMFGDEILRTSRTCRHFFLVSRSNDLWRHVVARELPFVPSRDFLKYYVDCNSKRAPRRADWASWRKTEEIEQRIVKHEGTAFTATARSWKKRLCLNVQPIVDILLACLFFVFTILYYLQLEGMDTSWWVVWSPILAGAVIFLIRGTPFVAGFLCTRSAMLPTYVTKRWNPRFSTMVSCVAHRRAHYVCGRRLPRLHCSWLVAMFLGVFAFFFTVIYRLEQDRNNEVDRLDWWLALLPFLIVCGLLMIRTLVCWAPPRERRELMVEESRGPETESFRDMSIRRYNRGSVRLTGDFQSQLDAHRVFQFDNSSANILLPDEEATASVQDTDAANRVDAVPSKQQQVQVPPKPSTSRLRSWLTYLLLGVQTIPPFITMLLLASRFSDSTESLSDLNPYIVFSPMYAQELILAVGFSYYWGCNRRKKSYSTLCNRCCFFWMLLGIVGVGFMGLVFPVVIIQIVICERMLDPSFPLYGAFIPIWYLNILIIVLFIVLYLRKKRYRGSWKLGFLSGSLSHAPAVSPWARVSFKLNRKLKKLQKNPFFRHPTAIPVVATDSAGYGDATSGYGDSLPAPGPSSVGSPTPVQPDSVAYRPHPAISVTTPTAGTVGARGLDDDSTPHHVTMREIHLDFTEEDPSPQP